jgi:hypothetical protein
MKIYSAPYASLNGMIQDLILVVEALHNYLIPLVIFGRKFGHLDVLSVLLVFIRMGDVLICLAGYARDSFAGCVDNNEIMESISRYIVQ